MREFQGSDPVVAAEEQDRAILSGMRVVEGSAFVAAPIAGLTLAQLGADVVRFDPIGGGLDYRRWPLTREGRSLYWAGLNKGKRSIAVDVRSPAGRELVTALITAARDGGGLYLTNLQYRWLEYEHLCKSRTDLIMMQLMGDSRGRPAFDYTVNAASGFPMVTGPVECDAPSNHVLPAWDLLAGMHAAVGLLAAERHRRVTGKGQLVQISLSDTALATVGNLGHIGEVQINGTQRPRVGNFVYGTFGCDFETGDGRRVMVVAMTPRQWQALCEATSIEEEVRSFASEHHVDLADEGERYAHRETFASMMRPWFNSRPIGEVGDQLDARGIPWGPYQSFRDLVSSDPRCSTANPLFAEVEQPGIGTYLAPGSPLHFAGVPRQAPVAAPLLGQHTDEVLADLLALSEAEIGRLHDEGVVAGAGA